MKQASLLDPLVFVVKVLGISLVIAIAVKTLAPQFPIPTSSAVGFAIAITPAMVMGAILTWQLWTTNHANSTHSGSD